MFTMQTLVTFLGWCSVVNIVLLIIAVIFLMAFKEIVAKVHSKLFGLKKEDLPLIYFSYLGNYKLAIIILNLIPYVALKIML
jgi:hypothetical protein